MLFSVQEANAAKTPADTNVSNQSPIHGQARDHKWWLRVSIYAIFVYCGESVATLLGRLYYDKGGNSKWMATLVQIAGFPMLLPYYCTAPTPKRPFTNSIIRSKPTRSALTILSVYISLGLLNGAVCLFHSIGLYHLPVSTYSLICASQLSFSALFSFFLNSQKFTPYIVNSLALLTISSILLLFQADFADPSEQVPGRKYVVGFICTICASAGYGLVLSLTQFAMEKIVKKEAFSAIMDMTLYQSMVATFCALVGLFTSGDWKVLRKEMTGFRLGKFSYVMTLTWTAISWQLCNIGAVGLILEVSSLFSNVISVLSLPVVPVLAVIFFHDKIDGIKVIAMVLATWGLMSYVYQHYIDSRNSKKENKRINDTRETASLEAENSVVKL
ncbi:probable purine permease 10 [Morus notabilis]|uniref:probable purine permease 10 n=1 Tax=Morus notabilis TaxID=981085 RepID=UPI000CED1642|nr:probable purine permease 10 [Morus notabilis]